MYDSRAVMHASSVSTLSMSFLEACMHAFNSFLLVVTTGSVLSLVEVMC